MTDPTPATAAEIAHLLGVDLADEDEAPSLIFEVPQVRWPTEATLTLVRDPGLREGQNLTLTVGGQALIYRITKVDPPGDDVPDGSWTVTAVEWTP